MMKTGDKMKRLEKVKWSAVFTALLAAALYGISSPASKILLEEVPPAFLAALLYLGAGAGMLLLRLARRIEHKKGKEAGIARQDIPYVLGMILLDIAAPILLMLGLYYSDPVNVSLLNNFEIVATTMIALVVFKEAVGKRLWLAIVMITAACIVLTLEDVRQLTLTPGSVFVLLACVCWGFENNCTRMLSIKDPNQIVIMKGFGSGLGAFGIASFTGQLGGTLLFVLLTMLLGFVSYGLSIYFYIKAQRILGASRTSAYYAAAPFMGVIVSWMIFREEITHRFILALGFMLAGAWLAATELHTHKHVHEAVTHDHMHSHSDGHHNHMHEPEMLEEHSHVHTHAAVTHDHFHTPDLHHAHTHKN